MKKLFLLLLTLNTLSLTASQHVARTAAHRITVKRGQLILVSYWTTLTFGVGSYAHYLDNKPQRAVVKKQTPSPVAHPDFRGPNGLRHSER